ncbi:OsmC family protein [Flavobacterium sp.]|uniref:OsmC family protein n=1 Tax=Flavobacterium sp. TaxID=239 RepID=UPI003751BB1C
MANLLENDITGTIGKQKYLCTISWRNGTLLMDEPESIDGKDLGPDPYTTLLASLAGCTLSTLRMYIDRKGWEIPEINIALNMSQEINPELETTISRTISFSSEISEVQKERLLLIAEKCPVSKILKNKVTINTNL